jgi:Domain of unknown function (DUF4386)
MQGRVGRREAKRGGSENGRTDAAQTRRRTLGRRPCVDLDRDARAPCRSRRRLSGVFAKYAKSNDWVAVHLIQFASVLLVVGGLLVLYRVLQMGSLVPVLAGIAVAAAIAAAAAWAVLQAIDGVALKHAVDAWANASGAQKPIRYADAQTVRWAEYGMNTYFRLLLGLAVALFGIAIARTGIVARWLGWAAVIGGLAYMSSGVAVAYAGFESGFESAVGIVAQLGFLIFAIGLLVTGVRRKDPTATAVP